MNFHAYIVGFGAKIEFGEKIRISEHCAMLASCTSTANCNRIASHFSKFLTLFLSAIEGYRRFRTAEATHSSTKRSANVQSFSSRRSSDLSC